MYTRKSNSSMDTSLMSHIWQGFQITFPIYPWYSQTTKQVYPCNVFREMIKTNTTWKMFFELLEDFQKLRNKYIGYNLRNHEQYLVRNNQRFAFGIYCNRQQFCLWDDASTSLGGFDINPDEVPSEEFIAWIENVTKNYCENLVPCSDCGKLIKKSEIAGRYFAGIYCRECWEREWKAKEAKETYD